MKDTQSCKRKVNLYMLSKPSFLAVCKISLLEYPADTSTLRIYSQAHYFLYLLLVPITVNIIIILLAPQAIKYIVIFDFIFPQSAISHLSGIFFQSIFFSNLVPTFSYYNENPFPCHNRSSRITIIQSLLLSNYISFYFAK